MSKLSDWFDDRTGCRKLLREALYERIPGGAKWRYVWGSTLVFTFCVQVITGLCLWAAYSPSSQTAWESVYYIQHEMQWGWFLRGLHHFTAQAMVVLLALHVLQVVIAGAYRPPRELNWWLGLVLLFATLGLSLTGYLLPWDEKGYWATQVATKIIGITPILGPSLQRLLVGGPDYGNHTLTRFFALHAGLLPILLSIVLVAHVALFRRHGVTHPKNARGATTFWPDQMLRDAVASLVVLAVVVFLVLRAEWGAEGGAHLGAPADPSHPYAAARPEWYFLFLFQLLKYFPGEAEVVGAIVIPTAVVGLLVLFPLFGRARLGHAFCLVATFVLTVGVGWLTYAALRDDAASPDYQRAVERAEFRAQRAVVLAERGIGKQGAAVLLRDDPLLEGPLLFKRYCASCHRWNGHDGTGEPVMIVKEGEKIEVPATASDLAGFGRQVWIAAFLRNPAGPEFFGRTAHKDGQMVQWAEENIPLMTDEEIEAAAALLASQAKRKDVPTPAPELVAQGLEVFNFGSQQGAQACTECHRLEHPDILVGAGLVDAPDLTGYASEQWLYGMISDPTDPRFYGENNDGMPKFSQRLNETQIKLLIDWMRGQWYRAESENFSQEQYETTTAE